MFETFWLKEADCGNLVTEVWGQNGPLTSLRDIQIKLKLCAVKLMEWNKIKFGNIRRQIEVKSREVESLYSRSREEGDDLDLFCMLLWAIWNWRNAFFNCGNRLPEDQVVIKAESFLTEFQKNRSASSHEVAPPHRPPLGNDWLAPPPGRLKLNTAFLPQNSSRCCGMGSVIRDDKGKVLAAWTKKIYRAFDMVTGTHLVLREGLLLADFLELSVMFAEGNGTGMKHGNGQFGAVMTGPNEGNNMAASKVSVGADKKKIVNNAKSGSRFSVLNEDSVEDISMKPSQNATNRQGKNHSKKVLTEISNRKPPNKS
ncbi:hypothetical protein EZV62_018948 [Acer yangbiense]|uniref:RNase H type-1 domain-containing protein n=1 Tax=Acer yangbiense TaxID=1000413 RepID=A0A5C7HAZ4_9ROSI|nr:hypothetical protein EZV62_018948 [Acer yangbiense]